MATLYPHALPLLTPFQRNTWAFVVPSSWGRLGCRAESRSCLNTTSPSCFLNPAKASQQGWGQGLERQRQQVTGEETLQELESGRRQGCVSNKNTPGRRGASEDSRLHKIPTSVQAWPGSLREPQGCSSSRPVVRERGHLDRNPPPGSASCKIPDTFAELEESG